MSCVVGNISVFCDFLMVDAIRQRSTWSIWSIGSYMKSNENNIREARRLKGMTQAALAKQLGVSANYICQLETGRRVPSLKTLSKIAAVLNVRAGSLLEKDLQTELEELSSRFDIHDILEGLKQVVEQYAPQTGSEVKTRQ